MVAKIQPYNPPIITHEISNFILYDMCMRDDYHAHISHLSGIMKRHFFPSASDKLSSEILISSHSVVCLSLYMVYIQSDNQYHAHSHCERTAQSHDS